MNGVTVLFDGTGSHADGNELNRLNNNGNCPI
jgi:hypothetical protein